MTVDVIFGKSHLTKSCTQGGPGLWYLDPDMSSYNVRKRLVLPHLAHVHTENEFAASEYRNIYISILFQMSISNACLTSSVHR